MNGGTMTPVLLFLAYAVLIAVAMYLFVYLPNKKKQRKMKELHDSIKPGDTVVTIGGIVGRVVRREPEYVTILVDEEKETTVKVVLYAVGQVLERG